MTYINQAKNSLFNEYLTTIPSKADLPPEIKQWLSDIEWQLHTAHSLLYCLCAASDEAAERQGDGKAQLGQPDQKAQIFHAILLKSP